MTVDVAQACSPIRAGYCFPDPLSCRATVSAIRSILLHLDATPGSAARLAVAEALAARHGARVTALFGVRSDGVRA